MRVNLGNMEELARKITLLNAALEDVANFADRHPEWASHVAWELGVAGNRTSELSLLLVVPAHYRNFLEPWLNGITVDTRRRISPSALLSVVETLNSLLARELRKHGVNSDRYAKLAPYLVGKALSSLVAHPEPPYLSVSRENTEAWESAIADSLMGWLLDASLSDVTGLCADGDPEPFLLMYQLLVSDAADSEDEIAQVEKTLALRVSSQLTGAVLTAVATNEEAYIGAGGLGSLIERQQSGATPEELAEGFSKLRRIWRIMLIRQDAERQRYWNTTLKASKALDAQSER